MTWFSTALAGLLTGAGLIVAIGPQNVMVLRTGVARTHVRSVVAVCATSDIVLILGGVAGLGTVVSGHPSLVVVATVLGGGYVIVLGLVAARRAFRAWRGSGEALTVTDEGRQVTRTVSPGSNRVGRTGRLPWSSKFQTGTSSRVRARGVPGLTSTRISRPSRCM